MLNLKYNMHVLKCKLHQLQTKLIVKAGLQVILCFILPIAEATAQTSSFKTIAENFDLHRKKALQEKMFLHLDRPVYVCGETMWYRIYNVDGTLHKPLDVSKVAYVEVLNSSLKPVLQSKIALENGGGNGSFILPASLTSGNYTVRAYTNWMKNFAPEFYFEQPVTIVNTFQKTETPPTAPVVPAYTIQFFPEGGNMVAGVANKLAFKAVNRQSGKGVNFTGEIRDEEGVKVAEFKPHKFGIGHFTFIPAAGAKYTATIKLQDNTTLRQQLPEVYDQGYTVHLEEAGAAKLKLTVSQVGQQAEQVYLLAHTRQIIAAAEAATINQGEAVFLIDRTALADGITHFTVFNAQKKPVCERLYFKQPTQVLELNITTDKKQYSPREKVSLNMVAQENAGRAGTADLSLAVYRLDSLQQEEASNIETYLWLTSDLKGTIENPAYYFTEAGRADTEAVDNLMLTHGWSRFKWEEILSQQPGTYSFIPEYGGHWITGKVTHNSTGAPAPGIFTFLSSPSKHIRFYNSKSDASGLVQFEVKDFIGPRDIVVQSNFNQDSTYHFEIFSPFSDKYSGSRPSVFSITDKLQQELTLRHVQVQVQQAYFGTYRNRFAAPAVDSIAFYGKPDEHYLLDDYKRFKVMEEVMREYVPGVMVRRRKGKFHFMTFNQPHRTVFENNPMVLLDGVPVFDIDKIMAFDPLKIKKLEVIKSRFFSGLQQFDGLVSYTTYTGDLGGFELDPRALLQEYDGLQLQREFYAPVYETDEQKQSRLADLRNLLYWAPELKVKLGQAHKTDFYTSDQVGTYLVVVQGITDNGLAVNKTYTLTVGQPL